MKNTYGENLRENLVQLAAARLVGDLAKALKESGYVIVSQLADEFIIEKGDLQMKGGLPDGMSYGNQQIKEGAVAYEALHLGHREIPCPYGKGSQNESEWKCGYQAGRRILVQQDYEVSVEKIAGACAAAQKEELRQAVEEKNANPLVDVDLAEVEQRLFAMMSLHKEQVDRLYAELKPHGTKTGRMRGTIPNQSGEPKP